MAFHWLRETDQSEKLPNLDRGLFYLFCLFQIMGILCNDFLLTESGWLKWKLPNLGRVGDVTQSNRFPEGGVFMVVWCGYQNRIISNVHSFFYFLNLKTYVSILLHFNLQYISCLISSENLLLNQTIFLTEYFSSVSFTFLSEVKEITIKEICDGYSIFPVQTLIKFCCRPINQITPRMWFLILPCSCYIFPSKLITRIWC